MSINTGDRWVKYREVSAEGPEAFSDPTCVIVTATSWKCITFSDGSQMDPTTRKGLSEEGFEYKPLADVRHLINSNLVSLLARLADLVSRTFTSGDPVRVLALTKRLQNLADDIR